MKQFKTESKRILDLMINSIYTNKEIFLRELISNASDAIDKLHFLSLTDSKVDNDFKIVITLDKQARKLTISDNGVGMSVEDLEKNLGTIASSGTLAFKKENEDVKELIEKLQQILALFGVLPFLNGLFQAFDGKLREKTGEFTEKHRHHQPENTQQQGIGNGNGADALRPEVDERRRRKDHRQQDAQHPLVLLPVNRAAQVEDVEVDVILFREENVKNVVHDIAS